MRLQINENGACRNVVNFGAWRNVVNFEPAKEKHVRDAALALVITIGGSVEMRILDDEGKPTVFCGRGFGWRDFGRR